MTAGGIMAPGAARRQALSALVFVGVVVGAAAASVLLVDELLERSDAVTRLRDRLAQIESRTRPARAGDVDAKAMGSPFLEGPTITVASAALQQRVDSAVVKAGGSVLSSQVDLEGPQAADGFVSLTEYIEIAQPALQTLLYDIEAGMPFLFVDTLGVQTPQGAEDPENARLVVVMGVTGQWQPAR